MRRPAKLFSLASCCLLVIMPGRAWISVYFELSFIVTLNSLRMAPANGRGFLFQRNGCRVPIPPAEHAGRR